jgi:DNA polymerase-3 subunit alpha
MIAGNKSKTNPLPQLFAEPSAAYALPDLQHHRYENALDEMDILGFPLCSPFDLISEKVPPSTVLSVDMGQYKGRSITMLGYLVTIKPTRTIKGEEMCFGTWIDAQGVFFDTTHFPNTNRQYPFRGSGCYLITGIVDDDFDACSLRVQHMRKLGWINHQTLYATAS